MLRKQLVCRRSASNHIAAAAISAIPTTTTTTRVTRAKSKTAKSQEDRWYKKQLRLGVLRNEREVKTLLPADGQESQPAAQQENEQSLHQAASSTKATTRMESSPEEVESETDDEFAPLWRRALLLSPEQLNGKFGDILAAFENARHDDVPSFQLNNSDCAAAAHHKPPPPQWHVAVALLVHLDASGVRPNKHAVAASLRALMSPESRRVSVDMLVQLEQQQQQELRHDEQEVNSSTSAAEVSCLFMDMRNVPAATHPATTATSSSSETSPLTTASAVTTTAVESERGGSGDAQAGIIAARWDVATYVISKFPKNAMPGASTAMSAAVRSAARAKQWEVSLHIFDAMRGRGVSVNPYSVSSLVALLSEKKMDALANRVTCQALELPDASDVRQSNTDSRHDVALFVPSPPPSSRSNSGAPSRGRREEEQQQQHGKSAAAYNTQRGAAAVMRAFKESVAESDWWSAVKAFQHLLTYQQQQQQQQQEETSKTNVVPMTAAHSLVIAPSTAAKFARLLAERSLCKPLFKLWHANVTSTATTVRDGEQGGGSRQLLTLGAVERALVRSCDSVAKRGRGWAVCITVYTRVVQTLERKPSSSGNEEQEQGQQQEERAPTTSSSSSSVKVQLATIALKACRVDGRWEEALAFFHTLNQRRELLTFPMMTEAIGSCSKSGFTLVRAQLWLRWLLDEENKKCEVAATQKSLMLLYSLKDASETRRNMERDEMQTALTSSPTVASAAFALLLARSRSRADTTVWAAALQTLGTIILHQRASYLTAEMITAVIDMCVRKGHWERAFDVLKAQTLLDVKPTRQALHMLLGSLDDAASASATSTRRDCDNFWATALALLESASAAGCIDRPIIDRVTKMLCVASNRNDTGAAHGGGAKEKKEHRTLLWVEAIKLVTRYRNFTDYSLSHIFRCENAASITAANVSFLLKSIFPVAPGHVLGRRVVDVVNSLMDDATLMNQWQICCCMLASHIRAPEHVIATSRQPHYGANESSSSSSSCSHGSNRKTATATTMTMRGMDPYTLYHVAKLKCSIFDQMYRHNDAASAVATFQKLRELVAEGEEAQQQLSTPILLAALDAMIETNDNDEDAGAIAQYLELTSSAAATLADDEAQQQQQQQQQSSSSAETSSPVDPSLDDAVRATMRNWETALEMLNRVRVL